MGFFKAKKTEAEKQHARWLEEIERGAKAYRKQAAKERKAHEKQAKQQQKQTKRQEKQQQKQAEQQKKIHRKAVRVAKKASKTRIRLARKAEKQRARQAAAAAAAAGAAPPFRKSAGCYVCGKTFALQRRRHHCRQCRESCCTECTSRTRRVVPRYGLSKPQKVCVVCETLVFNTEQAETPQPREPAEAVAALAASGRTRRAQSSRRPHSAPLPRTEGVTVTLPLPVSRRGRARARSSKSKGPSFWTLPIRPLLKRKKSAEQLRNRKMDEDLQIQKRLLFGGRAIELQPQAA